MKCALCGYYFEADEMMECKGCPFTKGCNMIRCPNCGFEEPADAHLVNVLKQWRQ